MLNLKWMILQRIANSNMRELTSFIFLLGAFALTSVLLHWFSGLLGLYGLPAFLLYCFPLLCVIAYTTADSDETFFRSLARNALWGYSFIIVVAALAWVIGKL